VAGQPATVQTHPPSGPAAPRAVGVRAWLPLAMVLAGAYLGVAMISPPAFGLWQDDAVYVVTARSLAEGSGYRHLEMPQQPLQTKYPPLFPALLAVVFRLWDDWPANLPALHAVTAVSGAVFVLLAWWYLARRLWWCCRPSRRC